MEHKSHWWFFFWMSLLYRHKCQTTRKVVLRSEGKEKMKRQSDISWSLAWKGEKYSAETWQREAFKDFLSEDNSYKPSFLPPPQAHTLPSQQITLLSVKEHFNFLPLPLTHHHIYKDSFTGSSIHSNWDIAVITPLKLSVWSLMTNGQPHWHFSEFFF